ncbi:MULTISPECIES: Shedu anti-phage system protein SduA domain-containing protein [unclassified Moraxella]|uniref:Shedu anti-phage system protein SduA domain-containing protein n=1 Tax=unclassified Moraxella TaxID=2685852 RepID=UPI003AF4DA97
MKILNEVEHRHMVSEMLFRYYFKPLYTGLKNNPELIEGFTGFLINPQQLRFYQGKTHLAIEYLGSEVLEKLPDGFNIMATFQDCSLSNISLMENIIGFNSTSLLEVPIFDVIEDLIWASNDGFDKLTELGWNYEAQNSFMIMNSKLPSVPPNQFCRIVNGFFFDANDFGLVTRHVKCIDFIPIQYDDSNSEFDIFKYNLDSFKKLAVHDLTYVYPMPSNDYKYKHLPRINRFIELWGNSQTSETDITSFLSETDNRFIIAMAFGAENIYPQVECEWQSEEKNKVIPDFLIEKNGRVTILEFKLPTLKGNAIVGINNRETLSSMLNSYISQTRVYKEYFDDPRNREYVNNKIGIDVYKPNRVIIVGRRQDFDRKHLREIVAEHQNLDIITFDDLIDSVTAQFYHD